MAGTILRQLRALVVKNWLLVCNRERLWITIWRAFTQPVLLAVYLSLIILTYSTRETMGVGSISSLLPLSSAIAMTATSGHRTLPLVNSGYSGGEIDRVIDAITHSLRDANSSAEIVRLASEYDLLTACPSSLRGATPCYGAVVFHSSPSEGVGGIWNYTLCGNSNFGVHYDAKSSLNDVEVYTLPLQHAVDNAIVSIRQNQSGRTLPANMSQLPYTSVTQKQYTARNQLYFQSDIVNFLAPGLYVVVATVIYQMVGTIAQDREAGMTDLMEAMMVCARPWHPQALRILSYILAFGPIYLPGWLIAGIIFARNIFVYSSAGIIVTMLLGGAATTSFSILGASFFRREHLSGISVMIVAVILSILGQVAAKSTTAAIVVLSVLFTPMTFVFTIISLARWEEQKAHIDLLKNAPNSPWHVPAILFWAFFIIQIFVYPLLGAAIERWLHGTRTVQQNAGPASTLHHMNVVEISNLRKEYSLHPWYLCGPSLFSRYNKPVLAVDDLSLSIAEGQIVTLLGPNGSGKSTILSALASLIDITRGCISVRDTHSIGICPQRNVIWDLLTVRQHLFIFNNLKSLSTPTNTDIDELVRVCDLESKLDARSSRLSGGQKRKLQLCLMLVGGSQLCCIDEVSSGLDPLSRRKVWDILLAERGKRTLILSTHFLDEAEYLSDNIFILAEGRLVAEGSSTLLKQNFGGGYRLRIKKSAGLNSPVHTVSETAIGGAHTFPDTTGLVKYIRSLEAKGISEYEISVPSMGDVFMKLCHNEGPENSNNKPDIEEIQKDEVIQLAEYRKGTSLSTTWQNSLDVQLSSGSQLNFLREFSVLFWKRLKVAQNLWYPPLIAFCAPVVVAGIVTYLLRHYTLNGCSLADTNRNSIGGVLPSRSINMVVGPKRFVQSLNMSALLSNVTINVVDSISAFENYVEQNFSKLSPGGLFFGARGSTPVFAYQLDAGIYPAVFVQNLMDVILSNTTIATEYTTFNIPLSPHSSEIVQVIFYFSFVLAVYPAFFTLYPASERLRKVRQMEYSNGVRPLPLWFAYLMFDSMIVLLSSAIATIILAAASYRAWYHLGYVFVVLNLYGMAATLVSYIISFMVPSQLAAFAFMAAGQVTMVLVYMTAWINILVDAPPNRIGTQMNIVQFILAFISPMISMLRALFVGLNFSSTICTRSPPGMLPPSDITMYGGPIAYLIVQCFVFFIAIVWWEQRSQLKRFAPKKAKPDPEQLPRHVEIEVAAEAERVKQPNDGLRIVNASKIYRTISAHYGTSWDYVHAVSELSFGVPRGEIFSLQGPNGAGKSTVISMISGDVSISEGDVFVQNIPVRSQKAAARSHLGVCPQHDAIDHLTVLDQLRFYAKIRGVPNVEDSVQQMMRIMGLGEFQHRMAAALSGGNQRKLSVAIAFTGSPEVLVLDEPSSGMDPLIKRQLWRTILSLKPGRSILLCTHSMEESDALANRVGVMAKTMLDIGSSEHLRHKYGDSYHLHITASSAPSTTDQEMSRIQTWIESRIPGARLERKACRGQLRFNVPITTISGQQSSISPPQSGKLADEQATITTIGEGDEKMGPSVAAKGAAVLSASLFCLLEDHREEVGLESFSIVPATFDQVFLAVVGKFDVGEEDHQDRRLRLLRR